MGAIDTMYELENLHPTIQQFVRDIDVVYVKIWDRFQIRTHLPRCETFPNSRFLDLFDRCHRHLTTFLNVYEFNHSKIWFPNAISIHEFMNGVECKVSIPSNEFHRIRPYRSEEMQQLIADVVCHKWFRFWPYFLVFQLTWANVSWWNRVWYNQSEYSWIVTVNCPRRIMDFYKLMQYFFPKEFRHKHLKAGKVQWFLHKSKLEECLELFTPMHARLPNEILILELEPYLITDLAKLCIGYL